MLTLKAPIQLHIAQNLTGNAEAFGERIRGNYGLLGAHFAAKDLLFLMTAPPELPEDPGGMTTLVNQQNTVDVRNVTMEVVNHVINRILLDGTEQFTYQDQVYITAALNKLGITNVSQFMEQVRQLRLETASTVHLTRLYQSELERILQRQAAGEAAPALPLAAESEEEADAAPRDPRITLCMEILNRLGTTNLYETVHAFQHSWTSGNHTIRNQELRLSEQLRFSNAVSLAQIKQQIYQKPEMHLLHHWNVYETGEGLEVPQNEEEVLSQAAAAALAAAVDHTWVEVLNRPQFHRQTWVEVKHALWEVAENTLSRFEQYHTQPPVTVDRSARTEMVWNTYVQELQEYQTLYRQMYPKAEGRTIPPRNAEARALFLRHLMRESRVEETDRDHSTELRTQNVERSAHQTLLRETLRQTRQEPAGADSPASAGGQLPDMETVQLTYRQEQQQEHHTLNQQSHQTVHIHEHPAAEGREEPAGRMDGAPAESRDRETLLRQEREERMSAEHLRQIIRQQLGKGAAPAGTDHEPMALQAVVQEAEPEPGEAEAAGHILRETASLERRFSQEHNRETEMRTLREYLRAGEMRFGMQAAPLPQDSLLVRNVHHREQTLIHRWQNGQTLSAEEQAEIKTLLHLPELHQFWPPKPSAASEAHLRERIQTQQAHTVRQIRETAAVPPQVEKRERVVMPRLELHRHDGAPGSASVQPVALTLREAEEQAPEVLLEEITRIDRHNRSILQAVQQERQKQAPVLPAGPDIQRTMRDALRALQEPEHVLRELQLRREQAAAMEHPALTAQENALLRQAQPQDQAVYEAVLAYQKNPEAALAQGLIKPGNLGALHAALQKAAQEETPLELTHPADEAVQEERRQLQKRSEEILERFHRLPNKPRGIVEETAPPPAVKIVHKQMEPEITEELLEQIREGRTASTVRTDTRDVVTHQQTHQTDVNQIERKVVAQTTEDITELINRTLARQMRTISDQVYRQMERRLQAERSRRGRM